MGERKICVLVVDNETTSLKRTLKMLQANSLVLKVESATDSDEALLKIINSNPDVVFLEYPVIGKAGNELIRFIKTKLTETTIVYVSKSKEYAENAIRNGVFNYLLNPVSKVELEKIINKVHLIKQNNIQVRINQIIEKIPEDTKLRFQTISGFIIVDPDEILFCKANGVYTDLYLTNDRVEYSFLFISRLDEILSKYNFLRVSRFYLINQKYIRKLYRSNNTIVLIAEGKEYEIKSTKEHVRNLSKLDTE